VVKNFRYLITIKNQNHEKYPYCNRVSNGHRAVDIGSSATHLKQKRHASFQHLQNSYAFKKGRKIRMLQSSLPKEPARLITDPPLHLG
jgi:hypothetical protein